MGKRSNFRQGPGLRLRTLPYHGKRIKKTRREPYFFCVFSTCTFKTKKQGIMRASGGIKDDEGFLKNTRVRASLGALAALPAAGEGVKEIRKADRLYTRNEAAAIVEKLEKALLRRNLVFPDAEESGLTDEVEEIPQKLLSRHGTDTEVVSGMFSGE